MNPTWYVSFEARHTVAERYYRRETMSFATETEAKVFARAIFAKGIRLAAGTINPVTPKRIIVSEKELSEWLDLSTTVEQN